MSKLVIRKRVELDFLGDEYKDAYLDFKSIPVGDYTELLEDIQAAQNDNKANAVILKIMKDYYLGGKFPNEKGELEPLDSKEELDGLDRDTLLECFGKMTGQDIKGAVAAAGASGTPDQGVQTDPKSDTPSKAG